MEMNQRSVDGQLERLSPLRMAGAIFLIMGLIFLLIGAFIFDRQRAREKDMQEGTGLIVSFSQHGYPYIVYELNGETYRAQLGFYSSGMKLGDELTIRFDPQVPEHVEIGGRGALFLPIIFMGMGALFSLIGGALLLLRRRILRESETSYWQ